jgi:hypothetical protein
VAKSKQAASKKAMLQFIEEHGFGNPPPPLNKSLSVDVFKQHYYDKKELMKFCRDTGISTGGLKEDLTKRVEIYLRTGKVTVVQAAKSSTTPDSESGLSLDKVVINYKSDTKTRQFFKKHLPEFTGFSALVQKQIKQRLTEGEKFTYNDVINMHKQFLQNNMKAKANGRAAKVAHKSCEYNQFSIDFKNDPSPKLHTLSAAWMLVRNSAGDKTYQRYKDRIKEIQDHLNSEAAADKFSR